jgi:type IV secretion system protein VirD4
MTFLWRSADDQRAAHLQRAATATAAMAGSGIYLGHDDGGWCFAPPQRAVLVLGPPRSGKTSSFIIPNVLTAAGPVVSTSTKPEVLDATADARRRSGRCFLFDPTGAVPDRSGVEPLRWSPLQSCGTWEGALSASRTLVEVAAPPAAGTRSDASHWTERAHLLLATMMHAAALEGLPLRTVLAWVDRRKVLEARQILAGAPGGPTELADNALEGIAATDDRELSGIWSTASGTLSGFRTEAALTATDRPTFDPDGFVRSGDTLYLCGPAHRQAQVAPLLVGVVEEVRTAAYAAAADREGRPGAPTLLALDEVANIAPLPTLPSMVSEGGGQGLATLACLQDLSQARRRWPGEADGLPTLFGTTVILPGIGDVRTLEALAALAGDEEVPARGVSWGRGPSGHPVSDLVTGGRTQQGASAGTQRRRRLPPDVIARGAAGFALAFDERNRAAWVPLAPAHRCEPWRSLTAEGRVLRPPVARRPGLGR